MQSLSQRSLCRGNIITIRQRSWWPL